MNLNSFIRILRARWLTIAGMTVVAVVAAVVVTLNTPRSYTAATELIIDGKGQDPISGQMLPTRALSGYIATQGDIIRSRNVANKVIDQMGLVDNPVLLREYQEVGKEEKPSRQWLLSYLSRGVSVTPKQNSSVMVVAFNARDPALAAKLADAYAQAYIQTNIELRTEPAKQISHWYDEQLTNLRETLTEKQNALSLYQEKHGILASSDRLDLETERLAELSAMLTTVQGERLDSQSRSKQLQGSTPGSLPAHVLENPQIQKLSDELSQAQARLNDVGAQVGSNHPQYRKARREVESATGQLNKALKSIGGNMQSTIELSKSREEQLAAEVAAQKEKVLKINRIRNELSTYQQEVDNAQAAFDAALARTNQTRLESRSALTDIAILNTASVPTRPTEPNPVMNLLLSLIVGLLFGTAAALCWEWMDRRVRSAEELEARLGIPVLAYLPAQRRSWSKRELTR